MSSGANITYEFEGFRYDPTARKLWRNQDEMILLSPKAGDLLGLLLQAPGRFVAKEEIFDRIWTDTFVEDGVLTQNIYTLRKTLGRTADGFQIIENRTRLGYRVNAAVSVVSTDGRHGQQGLSAPTPHQMSPPAAPKVVARPERIWLRLAIAGIIVAALALVITASLRYWRGDPTEVNTESIRFQAVTDTGDIWEPAISRDGDFAAFFRGKNIFLKDLKSNREIKLDIPGVATFSSLQFTADGSSILFRPHKTLRKDENILSVSRFGGETKLIAERTWGSFGLSNDGTRIAFGRNNAAETTQSLMVKDLGTGEEKEVTRISFPEIFFHTSAPVWSPDNTSIIFVAQNYTARRTTVYRVDLLTGERTEIKASNLQQFEQIGFLADGKSLIASASEGGKFFHLWKLTPGAEKAQRLTNGLTNFGEISISADGRKILALQTTESSNIFLSEAQDIHKQQQLTFGNSNNIGQSAMDWTNEENLIYVAYSQENPMANLWLFNVNDRTSRALTANVAYHSDAPSATEDGSNIFFTVTETPFVNIRRIDGNGGGRSQVTNGTDGFRIFPQVTANGRYLYYIFRTQGGGEIIRRDLADNSESVLLPRTSANPVGKLALSQNGKWLTFINWGNYSGSDQTNFQFGVVSTDDPANLRFLGVKLLYPAIQMTPDGSAFDYVSFEEDRTMLIRQPTNGGKPTELFTVPDRRIFNFAWSKSGRRIAISHGTQQRDAVVLTGVR
jgi:DNA-binding winged helix-turn-helix (wHTH) protein/Tol biopolymer transport system component